MTAAPASMPRPFAEYTYDHVTVDAETVPATAIPALPPLGAAVEPEAHPSVTSDLPEPLTRVCEVPGVIDLAAYDNVGWPGALTESWVRAGVADRLASVAAGLPDGFGLAVFDGYRPLDLQRAIYEAAYADPALPPGFVSVPSTDPATPPPHLTGGTVDLTLTWRGQPLGLGTLFDDFTIEAHADSFEDRPGAVRGLRRVLRSAMQGAEFVPIWCEWWHFEFGTRRWGAIRDTSALYGAAEAPSVISVCRH